MKIKPRICAAFLVCVSITLVSCSGGGGGSGDDTSQQTRSVTISLTDVIVRRPSNGNRLAIDTSSVSNSISYLN